jgi:hypothetical protein
MWVILLYNNTSLRTESKLTASKKVIVAVGWFLHWFSWFLAILAVILCSVFTIWQIRRFDTISGCQSNPRLSTPGARSNQRPPWPRLILARSNPQRWYCRQSSINGHIVDGCVHLVSAMAVKLNFFELRPAELRPKEAVLRPPESSWLLLHQGCTMHFLPRQVDAM